MTCHKANQPNQIFIFNHQLNRYFLITPIIFSLWNVFSKLFKWQISCLTFIHFYINYILHSDISNYSCAYLSWNVLDIFLRLTILHSSLKQNPICWQSLKSADCILWRQVRPPLTKSCPEYYSKWHLMVRLQFWSYEEYGVTSSLPLLLDSGVIVPVRVPFIGQIDLFENY